MLLVIYLFVLKKNNYKRSSPDYNFRLGKCQLYKPAIAFFVVNSTGKLQVMKKVDCELGPIIFTDKI